VTARVLLVAAMCVLFAAAVYTAARAWHEHDATPNPSPDAPCGYWPTPLVCTCAVCSQLDWDHALGIQPADLALWEHEMTTEPS
jgi:hypothetical protein